VFDAMAVVQMLQPQSAVKTTYQMMALSFWQYILSHRQCATEVHVVFDRYIEGSLKTQTRQRRNERVSSSGPSAILSNMVVGDWKKVVSSTKSKHELTKFYTRFFAEHCHELLDDKTTVYIAGGMGEATLKVSAAYVQYVQALQSNHEETDGRMMLHVAHAAAHGANQVVVFSPDTDVLVLLVHHFPDMTQTSIYFKTGRKLLNRDRTRYIPIQAIVGSLTPQQLSIMLSVYCVTGCDTSSSFHGVGKKKAFQVMCKYADELEGLSELGIPQQMISPEAKLAAFRFVGLLYGHSNCTSLNCIRRDSMLGKKRVRPRKLPPTNDSFVLHLLRCTYKLLIWRSSLCPDIPPVDPLQYGYIQDRGTGLYVPQLMTQAVAPPELLNDLVCICPDQCTTNCACSTNEQPCTQACTCKGNIMCENLFTMLSNVETGADLDDAYLL